MALEIFWGSGSPFSWRVVLGAEIKGLAYESRLLEFSKGHMKAPDFLQMNPRARPVIKDEGFALFESLPILEYFEDRWPAIPLFGKEPLERASIRRLISEFESYLRDRATRVTGRDDVIDAVRRVEPDAASAELVPGDEQPRAVPESQSCDAW